jgi:hypothetical protein
MSDAPHANLSEGTLFARDFRILSVLGRGGMSVVYRALQISTNEERALKILHAHLLADPKKRVRFTREAKVRSQIASAHAVNVIACDVDPATDTPLQGRAHPLSARASRIRGCRVGDRRQGDREGRVRGDRRRLPRRDAPRKSEGARRQMTRSSTRCSRTCGDAEKKKKTARRYLRTRAHDPRAPNRT